MKRIALGLALLAAPAAAQLPGLWWHDVYMDAVPGTVLPLALGSEVGLYFLANSSVPFRFTNGSTRQLRVRAVAWAGGSLALALLLNGQQNSCRDFTPSTPFTTIGSRYPGWMFTDFVIGQVPGNNCSGPLVTTWHVGMSTRWSPPPQTGWIVTAVGGW